MAVLPYPVQYEHHGHGVIGAASCDGVGGAAECYAVASDMFTLQWKNVKHDSKTTVYPLRSFEPHGYEIYLRRMNSLFAPAPPWGPTITFRPGVPFKR